MTDLISRQQAIDAVISLCDDCDSGYCGSCRVDYPGKKDARKALEDLPSAHPYTAEEIQKMQELESVQIEKAHELGRESVHTDRQRGEWIDYTEDGYVECPFCHSATNCDGNKDELHFCFSCGADMRGEQDEHID